MNRRTALITLASATTVLSAPRFRVYARCLPDYLSGLGREAYQRRNAALAGLTTPAAVEARQQWVRENFGKLTGGEPERTPLMVREAGGFDRPGYRMERLSYESRPGTRIPANLYIPAGGNPPYPGVLFQMGHSLNGKANDSYQKCCQGLARLGYAVLAFDPMGQGERTYYRVGDADEEHSRAGRQMLLVGDTATRLQVWDAVRSLDVLAGHPMVDPKRLGSTGQSGGGTLTMLLAAVDDRLACAVVSCGNTENFACAGFNPPGSTDDAEQNLIDSGPIAFDRWDLLYPLAPKPLLVLASERDSFGTYSPSYVQSGEEEFAKLRRVYQILGKADRLEWITTALPHALTRQLRQHTYGFFQQWLMDPAGTASKAVEEPDVLPEPESNLLAGVRPARVVMARPTPAAVDRAPLAALLRVNVLEQPKLAVMGREVGEGCWIETIEIESAPGVFLPAYLFLPEDEKNRTSAPRSLLILTEPGGRVRRWREGDLYPRLAAAGIAVCALDVRGVGDLRPEVGRGSQSYTISHAREEAYTWASMMLGKPLLGQRVEDLIASVHAVKAHAGQGRRVVLAAQGMMVVPALCSAALEPAIETAYLSGGLVSWSSLMDVDEYAEPFANFLPGVLKKTDLPFIARAALPRRVVIAGAVDAKGSTVESAAVSDLYGKGVEVRAQSDWSMGALAAL
ncbi:MAG: acetylxylan esterase [Bryobacteraceae bacterium]|nr:acetylxylan esterase [Bryobacteraceae bacterium]